VKLERELKDGTGQKYKVVINVLEQGVDLERAIIQLAAKARESKRGTATDAFDMIEVVVTPIGGVEVVQLCEAALLCVDVATLLAWFEDKGTTSRPIACCAAHKTLCEEKAEHQRVTVTFTPIAAAAAPAAASKVPQ
jgi:hypothetical protein